MTGRFLHRVDFPRCAGVDRGDRTGWSSIRRFPRCAGVDRDGPYCHQSRGGFPPLCRGGPWPAFDQYKAPTYSPVVRGWTADVASDPERLLVFPRCAGVDQATRQSKDTCSQLIEYEKANIQPSDRSMDQGRAC